MDRPDDDDYDSYEYEPQHHRHRSLSHAPRLDEEEKEELVINPLQLSHKDHFDDEIVFGTGTGTDTDQADDELGTSDDDIGTFGGDDDDTDNHKVGGDLEQARDDSSTDDVDDDSGVSGSDPNKDVTEVERRFSFSIRIGRLFVFLLMLCLGGGAIVWVYLYLKGEEQDDSKEALNILPISFRALAEDLTAYALSSNQQYPLVTLPFFEVNAFHTRALSNVPFLALLPLVSRAQRDVWENYSVNNYERWIEESRAVLSQRNQLQSTNATTTADIAGSDEPITPFIFESRQYEGGIFSESRA
eukprot:CAMPEP_0168743076 /NCGR_PEP_ID=MMETSP0724-20121128/13373_1 /TAXON_ID=265536 /ORGANISM="Amphiprora sp., Strain CCMP467" /LENGTH=300 /DNA_ID=CAMNT_0008790661 /DNA_START=116 /DNA_END=1015 /DNA_ORIENTATION=-